MQDGWVIYCELPYLRYIQSVIVKGFFKLHNKELKRQMRLFIPIKMDNY